MIVRQSIQETVVGSIWKRDNPHNPSAQETTAALDFDLAQRPGDPCRSLCLTRREKGPASRSWAPGYRVRGVAGPENPVVNRSDPPPGAFGTAREPFRGVPIPAVSV